MGSPVCPPGPGSFVLVCLATAQSPDSPDEKSTKKSCFSGPLPQLRQGKHKPAITATVTGSEHGHPFLKELTERRGGEGRKKAESLWESSLPPLHSLTSTPRRRHPSSPRSGGNCATGLCSHLMNDLPKNTVWMRAGAATRWRNLPPI